MRSILESRLAGKRAGAVVIAASILCFAPSLTTGLAADDFFHKLILTGSDAIDGVPTRAVDMFVWASGDPGVARAYMDAGMTGWWTDPALVMAYFRPLTAFTHWLDHRLWPESPFLMHLQSILWFGIALVGLGALYRRLRNARTAPWVAVLALALYALDDVHAMTVAWIANRNAVVALALAVPVLLLHDAASHGDRRAAWGAPVVLAAALLAGEAALAIAAYLFAHALFVDPGGRRAGLLRCAPHAAVIAAWALVYRGLGYGARGSGLVVDPGSEPLRFLGAVAERLPILMTSQYAFPPTDLWEFYGLIRPWLPAVIMAWSVLCIVGIAFMLRFAFRSDPYARFWALGSLLACLPVCAQWPHDRLLVFVGIGAAPLIAALIARPVVQWQAAGRVAVGLLMFLHIVFGPLWLPVRVRGPSDVTRMLGVADRTIPDDPGVRDRTVVLVNPPMDAFAGYLPPTRAAEGRPRPGALRWLASGATAVEITRLDAYTLRVVPDDGFLSRPSERMQRGALNPLREGQTVETTGMTVTIDRVTADGRPAEVRVRFELPLDDPQLSLMHWTRQGFKPIGPPRVGESRRFEPIDFFGLLP